MKPFQLVRNLYDLHVEPRAQFIGENRRWETICNMQVVAPHGREQQMQNELLRSG